MHDPSRRRFVTAVAGWTTMLSVGSWGCSDAPDGADDLDTEGDETCTATDSGEPQKEPAPPQPLAACEPTPDNVEGPFYREGAPDRTNLVDGDIEGVALEVTGVVMDTECNPLEDAILDVWQCDAEGRYDNDGSMPGLPDDVYLLRGKLRTGPDGAYTFRTVIPGRYLNGDNFRPRHIHIKVSAPNKTLLTTQLYFDDDECNDIDPWVEPGLVMTLEDDGDGKRARFDFFLIDG